jgi:hypothetical protein
MERISKHISWNEATRSITALRNGIDNTPAAWHIENMKRLAENIFEPIREHFGVPIKVESFYRCPKLNKMIGGSPSSQHMKGQAIDIDDDYGKITNADMFYFIKENLDFDQLIWEFGNDQSPDWVHVSYVTPAKNRNQVLKI